MHTKSLRGPDCAFYHAVSLLQHGGDMGRARDSLLAASFGRYSIQLKTSD
jgi:hypothetical protein